MCDEGLTKLEEGFQIPSSHLKENNNDGLLSEVQKKNSGNQEAAESSKNPLQIYKEDPQTPHSSSITNIQLDVLTSGPDSSNLQKQSVFGECTTTQIDMKMK